MSMKAMILAAGRGKRLSPLTDTCPKPLLSIGTDTLISRQIKQLKRAGIEEIIINHAWLGNKIETELGDGSDFGVRIYYSAEGNLGLETAGGIAHALPLLGKEPFLVVNGDLFVEFDFREAFSVSVQLKHQKSLAHLWLVPNPPHHPQGDYSITAEGYLTQKKMQSYTFSGIGVYQPKLFGSLPFGKPYKLASLFNQHLPQGQLMARIFHGVWMDVGSLDRLQKVRRILQAS